VSRARFYPALDITWPSAPASDLVERVIAAVDEALPTAVEERLNGVRIFFATSNERDRAQSLAALTATGAAIACVSISDEAWAERSQSDLQPVTVGRLTIAPPWAVGVTSIGSDPSGILLTIQPSMGFGTGHHASTRLCLRLLQDEDLARRSVLDAGTGSGVLALAAWRLGARHVTAIDHDPDAVTAARENLERNGADDRLSLDVADLSRVAAGFAGRFDLVLANLTGAMLARFALDLCNCVHAGGAVIASGFQTGEVADVVAAFEALGFVVATTIEEDTWVALRAVRVRQA
jgi:ribosomal protein L11 methyltransferase